ncbi:MAG: asparagine synthase-related protein, partial [Actinomycetota bacterium]
GTRPPAAGQTALAMAQAAPHRGRARLWEQRGRIALAHLTTDSEGESRREGGREGKRAMLQPLYDARSKLVVVADARIDNRRELAGLLGARHLPAGRAPTDAELILASYERWGEGCAGRLVGDFAFAVWDELEGRLFAARDAMGMRSLYYRREEGGRLLIGTEVKQVLAAGGFEVRPFEPAIGAHLAGPFGLPEWTFYEGISQLPAAHALSYGEDGSFGVWRYWDAEPGRVIRCADEREYAERFLWVFEEAVRCRVVGQRRPVGLFLSGGMDSGTIASVGGRLVRGGDVGGEIRAYSWAFGGDLEGSDERHISSQIAGYYGIPVREVAAGEAWPLSGYPDHGPDRDSPLIWIYQPLIEKTLTAAREDGMGVVLSGDRGDEMVGDWVFDLLGALRSGRVGDVMEDLRELGRWTGRGLRRVAVSELLRPWVLSALPWGDGPEARRRLRGSGNRARYPGWVNPEFARRIGLDEIIEVSAPASPFKEPARRRRYERIFSFAISRLITLDERTRARFGLTFADPWSDRRLAELVLAMPQWRVQRPSEPKGIARRAMRGVMPESARRSVGKIEPVSLFDRGFKDRAKETVEGLISGSRAAARGYLDENALRRYYLSFLRGEPQPFDFWWALTLEMWLRRHWS